MLDSIPIIAASEYDELESNILTMSEQKETAQPATAAEPTELPQEQSQQSTDDAVSAAQKHGAVDSGDAPGGDAQDQDLAAELAAAQDEIGKLKDAFLRAKAEEDNVRRRSEKEVASSRKFAIEGFAKELIGVHDSLKLACAVELAADADEAVKSIHEGVSITLKQMDAAFAKFSLAEISPEVGDKLDPNLHQAMSIVESEDIDSGNIITVIQSGFQLHERLLRPAMVVVAK